MHNTKLITSKQLSVCLIPDVTDGYVALAGGGTALTVGSSVSESATVYFECGSGFTAAGTNARTCTSGDFNPTLAATPFTCTASGGG